MLIPEELETLNKFASLIQTFGKTYPASKKHFKFDYFDPQARQRCENVPFKPSHWALHAKLDPLSTHQTYSTQLCLFKALNLKTSKTWQISNVHVSITSVFLKIVAITKDTGWIPNYCETTHVTDPAGTLCLRFGNFGYSHPKSGLFISNSSIEHFSGDTSMSIMQVFKENVSKHTQKY